MFRLEDFQIVNGCQTSNIIFDIIYGDKANVTPKSDLKKTVNVPFRLIGSKNDDFVSSIIIGTNRQNPVRDEQFWALRPFMKNFEEYCRSLNTEEAIYFERRENQYRGQNIERTRLMQPILLMKAVVACLLFQPQRAARDYRGIVSEYSKVIFLDDQDVTIYHAVAYLYYKIEFMWRNQRLDSKYKTFRYYILSGIGILSTGKTNVFTMKKNKVRKVVENILSLCRNEEKLKEVISSIVSIIERRLAEMGITNQERIRDTIRSESFLTNFQNQVTKLGPINYP